MSSLTFVPSINYILLDNVALTAVQQDFSWVPETTYAVVWEEDRGHIEFNDGSPNQTLNSLGIYTQAITDHANEITRRENEENAILDATDWTSSLRNERTLRLNSSDWIVTRSLEAGQAVPAAWVTYRQALRDLPATIDASNHRAMCQDSSHASWPTPPS